MNSWLSVALARFRTHLDQHHAMPRHAGCEAIGLSLQILLPPEVPNVQRPGHLELVPADRDGLLVFADVEQADGLGAVFEGLGPDLDVVALGDATRLVAEGVLFTSRTSSLVRRLSVNSSSLVRSQPIKSGEERSDQRLICVYCSLVVR